MMLPQYDLDDEEEMDLEEEELPDRTYRMDFENKCIVGMCDGEDALRQAIQKILLTEWDEFLIYEDYGFESKDLNDKDMIYTQSEVKQRIKDAILADDRFSDVKDFSIERKKDCLIVSFTAVAATGEEIDEEAEINV